MSDHRLVVFRPGALGDTILTVDAFAALRGRFPHASIELVGNAQAGAVLEAAGIVQTVTSFDSLEVTGLYLDPPRVPERWATATAAVLWLPRGNPIPDALRAAGVRQVLVAPPPAPGAATHAADHLVATLAPLGITASPPIAELWPTRQQARNTAAAEPRLALVHPGSGAARKNWPPTRFAELIQQLAAAGWSVSLLAGPADAASVSQVVDALDGMMPDVIEPPSVLDLAAQLARAALYVGNDSGVTHLSARIGVPTIAIFGPTDPRQWAPRGPVVAVVRGNPWPDVATVCQRIRSLGAPASGSGAPLGVVGRQWITAAGGRAQGVSCPGAMSAPTGARVSAPVRFGAPARGH